MEQFQPQSAALSATAANSAEGTPIASAQGHSGAGQPRDSREIHATPHLGRFLALAAQLALLLLIFRVYDTAGKNDYRHATSEFLRLSAIAFGAFLIHYWLPFRFKEYFWAAVSIGGAFLLLEPRVAELLIAAGLIFFLILRSHAPFKWRVILVAVIFAALIYCRVNKVPHIPAGFYPVFGALFMFRIIVYVYDLSHSRERARLLPFLSYFFLLPNYIFPLFPVIDFQTMRRTYYQRDIHDIAQQGIRWMTRGAIQLMVYRLVLYFNDNYLPDRVTNFGALMAALSLNYLLYLNVSGQFHMIVGMLHLFGYDLPETNRRYLLASSMMDYWRRINIYWKDFMVKIVYYPVYFKLRKQGVARAQVLATAAVFIVTWALHSYQIFWIQGQLAMSWPDTLFWTILGMLVIGNVLWDIRHKRGQPDASGLGRSIHALKVLGTFAMISTLWSLWSSPTIGSWIYLMTHWAQGRG